MQIGKLIHFHDERFFDGAVQLRWVQTNSDKAKQAAQSFVFHGPRYHGGSVAENDGVDSGYRLKDSASFVRDLLNSLQAGWQGQEENPYWMVVAGYGSGKSHLALTCAALLGKQHDVTESILENISQADAALGADIRGQVRQLVKPVLVLPLDGMSGFHLGNALSQAVFAQMHYYGVDAGAIRDLSPRFQTAEQFVERNFNFRKDSFAQHLPALEAEEICTRLRDNDETIYSAVDVIYSEANGSQIPVIGQESAQELINTLCEVYCGPERAFSSVVILFDEFGRYLEYAADKPRLAGDAALQQIFQGVQDNSTKVRFIGFIQYELKAYLKRFGSADLRQLQRYITRFDAAQKYYLSTNLETIFAHMIGKNETDLATVWLQSDAEIRWQTSWHLLSRTLPEFGRYPAWSEFERFSRVIAEGCWPLHPLATWFLTRQRDVVQSRSALTFIKDTIGRIVDEDAFVNGQLRQISAAELVLQSLLPELLAAERETGASTAETLQLLLEKYQAHLTSNQQKVLAGVAVLAKMRIGKQDQDTMSSLIAEATALDRVSVDLSLRTLGQELGALEWNSDLGQFELIADAASRGQFQQWLRNKKQGTSTDAVRNIFIRNAAKDGGLGNIDTDFALNHDIRTTDWFFEAQFAHIHTLETVIQRAFQDWNEAVLPNEAKGRVVYVYLHAADDLEVVQTKIHNSLQTGLERFQQSRAPIIVVGVMDAEEMIAEAFKRLVIFDSCTADDSERFRRFIPEERERAQSALQASLQDAIKARNYWIAGVPQVPMGRLKAVGEAIFADVYSKSIPFPFDGFATSNGGGAGDAAQLMRNLVTGQVDGLWLASQPKKIQNRVQSVLDNAWKALHTDGRLVMPAEARVKTIYLWLQQLHQNQPERSLWVSYKALIAPPYGMNASSAGLLLGLLIGGINPPRRIEQRGELVASSDWVAAVFPNQKHFLKEDVLKTSLLRFLSEDAESRWRSLLERWESEENYQTKTEIAKEAEKMKRADPLPEILEGRYNYLRDKTAEVERELLMARAKRGEWEREIEKADIQGDVGKLLRIGSGLLSQFDDMDENPCWPQADAVECNSLLSVLRNIISARITDWLPRQACNTAAQINEFRIRMEKAVVSLKDLGFKQDANQLEQQAQRAILQVEKRQQYALTLSESDDYPRQPLPSDSTPVRELVDAIAKGEKLVEVLQSATDVLQAIEISSRSKAIKQRQEVLQNQLKRHRDKLGAIYGLIDNESELLERLTKIRQLQRIFMDTRDESELKDLIAQLERIQAHISTWETGNINPERCNELLQLQIPSQLQELRDFLNTQEIEEAWDLTSIYQAHAKERISLLVKRSNEWLKPRVALAEQITSMENSRCLILERELIAAPHYLSKDDREEVSVLLEKVHQRLKAIDEQVRLKAVAEWQSQLPKLADIEGFDKPITERYLKLLRSQPFELPPEELRAVGPILSKLTEHLDQISMDEIIGRIERLSLDRQRKLLEELTKRLA